jgi:hypothetical protein
LYSNIKEKVFTAIYLGFYYGISDWLSVVLERKFRINRGDID